jgi:hypothetical protein
MRRSIAMSAIPPKADIRLRDCNVRFVPKADKVRRSKDCSKKAPTPLQVEAEVRARLRHRKGSSTGLAMSDAAAFHCSSPFREVTRSTKFLSGPAL